MGVLNKGGETCILWHFTPFRVVSHRTCLRVIVCAGWVEVDEVLGGILSNTKVPNGDARLGVQFLTNSICCIGVLLLILVLIVARTKIVVLAFGLPGLSNLSHRSEVRGRLFVDLFFSQLLPCRLQCPVLIVDLGVLGGIVAVPPVALGGVTSRNILDKLVRSDVFAREFRPLLPWSLETVLLLVSNCTTVLACAFSVFLRSWTGDGSSVVPLVEFVRGVVVFRSALMG